MLELDKNTEIYEAIEDVLNSIRVHQDLIRSGVFSGVEKKDIIECFFSSIGTISIRLKEVL